MLESNWLDSSEVLSTRSPQNPTSLCFDLIKQMSFWNGSELLGLAGKTSPSKLIHLSLKQSLMLELVELKLEVRSWDETLPYTKFNLINL